MNTNRATVSAALVIAGLLASCGSSPDDNASPRATSVSGTEPPATLAPSTTVASASDEWIALQVDAGNGLEIYVLRLDGTERHPVAPDVPGGDQTNPDWSPDGNSLVFAVASEGGHDDLWTVGADGSDAARLLECSGDCRAYDDPAWSPDGASVAYTRISEVDGAVACSLEIVDIATGAVTVVATAGPSQLYGGAQWSPDGTAIVAEVGELAGPSLDDEIVAVTLSIIDLDADADQARFRPITDPALFAETADWSPDGEFIAYGALPSPESDQHDLFLIRPDGSGATRLTHLADDGANATHPAFSPDGTRIVFVGEASQLMSVPTAGGDVTSATGELVVRGNHPRFRPNGAPS